jgi:DNA-binding transcriptional ArsR family regulator
MDTLLTTGQLARRLSTTIPRVHRAVKAGIISPVGCNTRGHLLFDPVAEEALCRRWGVAPQVAELSRSETLVLAALARRPFGLRSARAVARAAGTSPTVAARALAALREHGLVRLRRLLVAEGEAREVDNWSVEWRSPEWRRIAPAIHQTKLPEPQRNVAHQPRRLPKRLWHLFWDVNPARTDLNHYADFVIKRVLEAGDPRALAWLVQTMPAEALRSVARKPGRLKPEVRRLAETLSGDLR